MLLAAKLLLSPLLVAQAVATRRRALVLPEADGPRTGRCGSGAPLRLLVVGDSSGAGVGVARQDEALVGHLSRSLAGSLNVEVVWQLVAKSGVTTAQALLYALPQARLDVASTREEVNVWPQLLMEDVLKHRALHPAEPIL